MIYQELPYQALFKVFEHVDNDAATIQVNKAWNEANQCFRILKQIFSKLPIKLKLLKMNNLYIVATGSKKFTRLFTIHLGKQKLKHLYNDSCLSLQNIFASAKTLLMQSPRGINVFLAKKGKLHLVSSLVCKKDPISNNVEALNDNYAVIQSILGKNSILTILDMKTGKQLTAIPCAERCLVKIVDDVIYFAQSSQLIKYCPQKQQILERINLIPFLTIKNFEVKTNSLSILVLNRVTKELETLTY